VVIAPSFGDIFKSNSFRCGLLPVELPESAVRKLIDRASGEPGLQITVDLVDQRFATDAIEGDFELDPFFRECLLNGWDEVGLTLRKEVDIAHYEAARPLWLPAVR